MAWRFATGPRDVIVTPIVVGGDRDDLLAAADSHPPVLGEVTLEKSFELGLGEHPGRGPARRIPARIRNGSGVE